MSTHLQNAGSYHFPYTQAVDDLVDDPADSQGITGTMRGTTGRTPPGTLAAPTACRRRPGTLSTPAVHEYEALTWPDDSVPRIHRAYYDYESSL